MMRSGIVLLILISVNNVWGITHLNTCREELTKKSFENRKKENPKITQQEFAKKMGEVLSSPSGQYMFETAYRTCALMRVKDDFRAGKHAIYCPLNKSKYRVGCLREWISQNYFDYGEEIGILNVITSGMYAMDMQEHKQDLVTLKALELDAMVMAWDRFTKQTSVFSRQPASTMMKNESNLMSNEEKKFTADLRNKVRPRILENFNKLKDMVEKFPDANKEKKKWLKELIASLETRIPKI